MRLCSTLQAMHAPARFGPVVLLTSRAGLAHLRMACVLGGLLASLPSEATLGGDATAGDFCLEKSGHRILYVQGEGGESDCDSLRAINLATGQDSELVGCSTGRIKREKLLAGCERLVPARLEELGLGAEIHRAGNPTYEVMRNQQVVPADELSFRCPQELGLRRGTSRIAQRAFSSCCSSAYNERTPPVAAMTAYALPGKPFLLVRLRQPGRCYETGYTQDELLFVRDAFKPEGAPRLQGNRTPDVKTWALLDLPPVDRPRLYNEIGFSLYQKGRLAEAVEYFKRAYEDSAGGERHLLALYNEAATLSRLGRTDEALAALRVLLSYATERDRFRKKVAQDKDFASLRTAPALTALLKEAECCIEEFINSSPNGSRQETVVRWVEGESLLLRSTSWKGGVKTREWDTVKGTGRIWYANGQLESEGAISPNGDWNGVVRTWRPNGTLASETEFYKGIRHGLERKYDEKGRLMALERWEDDVSVSSEPVPLSGPADAGPRPSPAP